MKRRRKATQLPLPLRTWGGKRIGAGPPARSGRPNVRHVPRPEHRNAHPVHVTMRAKGNLPTLRAQRIFWELTRCIKKASHLGFRVIQFCVQHNHMHVIVEAPDTSRLSRGVQGLAIRLARAVNRIAKRKGKVWGDRFDARDLKTPREVRNALAYVLLNAKKHDAAAPALDPYSSARWCGGWASRLGVRVAALFVDEPEPNVAPRTWLAREGWQRDGPLSPA